MNEKFTEKIKLWGIVQGVGFRPFVAKMADRMSMRGEVLNIGGLVEITVTDTAERIDAFVDALVKEKPGPSEIVHIKRSRLQYRHFEDFEIIQSGEGDDEAAMIPADLAICSHCLEELYDPSNPRYHHPFISCMVCGPRYTIIDRIPYDRDNTSMVAFPMCDFCESEYTNLHDRRHHAQTISCHECGPQLIWEAAGRKSGDFSCEEAGSYNTALLNHAAAILSCGGVIAFKCVGGYNLVANPFDPIAVEKLRKIKNRENKPFALMYRSLDQIREYCRLDEVEAKLLESSARPIILLEHRLDELTPGKTPDGRLQSFDDQKQTRFIGSFLPSLGAQYMLLDRISPLIFTSANLSDMPMVKDEDEMRVILESTNNEKQLIDGIIYNKRSIRLRADDSVARVIDGQPQMIRRSKGYAPVPLYLEAGSGCPSVLATGAQLKNSFVLTKGPFAYVSQYFGDLDTVENQEIYGENISRMSELFRIKPKALACDMHPLYYTTEFASRLADERALPLIQVQHHHAHVASVMAENNLKGPLIGVSFDGTGYGTDSKIWGGEFLLCEEDSMLRHAHLKYIDMVGGDSSIKDATRSALSYIYAYDHGYLKDAGSRSAANPDNRPLYPVDEHKKAQVSSDSVEIALDISDIIEFGKNRLLSRPEADLVMRALSSGINSIQSSSMGRLFDAVSSLLGFKDYNDYEGQCAITLEDAAAFAQKNPGIDRASDLAFSFHMRIIDMIVSQCQSSRKLYGVSQVALTGGSFQNKILMEGVLKRLREEGFEPYYNISVSPNDGGIALGQAFVAMHRLSKLAKA